MKGLNTEIDNVRTELCDLVNAKIQNGIPIVAIKNIFELLIVELNVKTNETKMLEAKQEEQNKEKK